jgi:RES domain
MPNAAHGEPAAPDVRWVGARRIIHSPYSPINLFKDIADPADWLLLISAEQKTNPWLMLTIGNLDLVPPERRVSGLGSSFLIAPFTHASFDRPSRFSVRSYGVLYVVTAFETALFETIHHHGRFMSRTAEPPCRTSEFRELVMDVSALLCDLRREGEQPALDPDDYGDAQALGRALRISAKDGIVYPSRRHAGGECAGLFYPDMATAPVQSRHLSHHWDGTRVDLVRETGAGRVCRVDEC